MIARLVDFGEIVDHRCLLSIHNVNVHATIVYTHTKHTTL